MAFSPIQTVDNFVWGDRISRYGRLGRVVATAFQYLYALFRDLFSGGLTMRAMSLVYTTLLSVVPFIAFSFSVLKGFGVHEQLQDRAYLFMEPFGDEGVEITDNVMRLVENVNGGVLGGISLAFFIYTAISMVQKVEESFNFVWYVSKPRSFSRRFTEYMFVMLVGPLAIALALGMITSLQNDNFVQWLLNNDIVGPLFVATSKLTPYIIVSLVFAFLYAFMPNTRVSLKSALLGGVAGGFMWASLGLVFTAFIVNSAQTQAVYASFAIAIVTLVWIYLNWIVLLLGAQVSFYTQHPAYLRHGRLETELSNSVRERLALNIMLMVGKAFRDPGVTVNVEQISTALHLPSLSIAPVVSALEEGGLLTANEKEHLLPGRDMASVTLDDILAVVRSGGETGSLQDPAWASEVDGIAKDVDMAIAKTIGTRTLSQFVDETERSVASIRTA
ncbi:MAG: YihY/virulence factor BrkB family protein [Pseudomonadota bacterium]